jgi:tetratricopeptide (TPR) repeat protein
MIIEQHYDDEVLIDLLEEAEEDTHVPVCDTCTGTLQSYRDLSSALHDNSVWDERELPETPKPETTNFLRAFAGRTRAEDAAAAAIVPKLIANPSLIDQHPEWCTAGVVRGLLAIVDEKNFTEPKVAAEIAALAAKTADSIEPGVYPLDTMMKLRGQAWRAHAHMLYYTGAYRESIKALDCADQLLRSCSVAEYEAARAWVVRAQVYNELERLDEAVSLADSASRVFRQFGDINRESVAEATKAVALAGARRFAEALPIFQCLSADARISDSKRVFYLHNAASCCHELSRLQEAKALFAQTVEECDRLGLATLRARASWHLAQVFLAEARYEDARALLFELRLKFEEFGMPQDVALTSIDAAEACLMLGQVQDVVPLCQAAMQYFTHAGLEYTQGALLALAYIKESAEAKALTRSALGNVRAYFEILPKQPHLLFAFPL